MEEGGQMRHPDAEVTGHPLSRSPPPPHRVRFWRGPGGGPDRLNALPDEMLLLVLARLRCSRSAAHTGVLSRRWRGLWTDLPDLIFRDIAPALIEAALASLAASPWVSNTLDIKICPSNCCDEAALSSLLHAAARFSAQLLCLSYQYNRYMEADLPCFECATVIQISSYNDICFTRLPADMSPAVETLCLDGCSVIDLGTLVTLCQRLRLLRVTASAYDSVVHSGSLQTLVLRSDMVCSSINIVTPMLKHLEMDFEADTDLSISISAPMVEMVEWERSFTDLALVFGFWRLDSITVFRPTDRYTHHEYWRKEYTWSQIRPVHVLLLHISLPNYLDDESQPAEDMVFAQEMEKLPVTDFSVVNLNLASPGHVLGGVVLRLFRLHQICAVTKTLIVDIPVWQEGMLACPGNCRCEEPKNWRSQSISFTRLEELQVYGFSGEDHEHDFLKLIFRSSPMLKIVTLELVPEFVGSIKEIYDTFLANPCVKSSVYDSKGALVRELSH